MKKIVLGMLVLMLAAPAMAIDVTFTAVHEGTTGVVRIYYDANSPPGALPRAFALDITVDNSQTIDAISDLSADYWVYPGSIDINDAGEVNNVGTPVADPCDLPSDTEQGLGTTGITIEMGSLYVGAANEPDPCALLCKVTVSSDCNLTVTGNVGRGKAVLEGAAQALTNLPISLMVSPITPACCPPDCTDSTMVGPPDGNMTTQDYYAIQGALAYADYLKSGGAGTHYVINGPTDAQAGHLWNACMDASNDGGNPGQDGDIDLQDYYFCQGKLAYADYINSGGAGTHYFINGPSDPNTGHLWPCP